MEKEIKKKVSLEPWFPTWDAQPTRWGAIRELVIK